MEINAVIMAAGTSSRFVPLSAEIPKGLLEVRGDVLIERQIRQLREAGITDITVVTGYKAGMFEYLRGKYGVSIVVNEDFHRYNNTSSVIRVLDRLKDTYLCSSDNYFPNNVFMEKPRHSYYSAMYSPNETGEYCINADKDGNIIDVSTGGKESWYMVGHVYFSEEFSKAFKDLLTAEYEKESTRLGYWEDLYIRFIHKLPKMKVRRYKAHDIEEFDTLDELRLFDESYIYDTRSPVVKAIARELRCGEADLSRFTNIRHDGNCLRFSFCKDGETYIYDGLRNTIEIR